MKKSILISAITLITSGLVLVPTGLAISPQTWYLFLMSAFGFAAIAFLLLLYGKGAINERFSLLIANSDKAHSELSSAIFELQDKLESSSKCLAEVINTLQKNTVEEQKRTVEEISSSAKLLTESNNKCLEELKSICEELGTNESATIEKEANRITNCITSSQQTIESISEELHSSLNQAFGDLTNLLKNSELENSKNISQAVKTFTDEFSRIESTFHLFGERNNKLITDISEHYNNVLNKIGQKENELVQSLENAMEDNLKKQQDSIGEGVSRMSESITTVVDRLFDNISLSIDEYKESLTRSIDKIKADFENSLQENLSGFNKVVKDVRKSLDYISNATDNLQTTIGGDLSDSLNNLANYIKHYDELKQSDVDTIKEIENLCRKK